MSNFGNLSDDPYLRKKILENLINMKSIFSHFSADEAPFGTMKGSPEAGNTFSYDFIPDLVGENFQPDFSYAKVNINFDTEGVQGSAVDEEKLKQHWVDEAVKAYREASKGEGFPEGNIFVGFDPSTKTVKPKKSILKK